MNECIRQRMHFFCIKGMLAPAAISWLGAPHSVLDQPIPGDFHAGLRTVPQ